MHINLTQGKAAYVDLVDYIRFISCKWCALYQKGTDSYTAVRHDDISGGLIYMHREVCGLVSGDGKRVKHVNGDHLDNRSVNLKVDNSRVGQTNKSLLGTGIYPKGRRYRAEAYKNGKYKYVGSFDTVTQARKARREFLNG